MIKVLQIYYVNSHSGQTKMNIGKFIELAMGSNSCCNFKKENLFSYIVQGFPNNSICIYESE